MGVVVLGFDQTVQTAGILGLSGSEPLVVLAVAFLLFGGKLVPKAGGVARAGAKGLASGLFEGVKRFRRAMKEDAPQPASARNRRNRKPV